MTIVMEVPCNNSELYDDYMNPSCDASLAMGAFVFAVIADIIATPLTFTGGSSYMKQRHLSGIRGLMIASWIIYAVQIPCGISLVSIGAEQGYPVPTCWVLFYLF